MFNKSNDGETLRLRLQSFPLGSQAWRARSVRYRAKACVTSLKRKFRTDITESTVNGVCEAILGGSRTYYKCSKCQIWLCIEGNCW
jgi:hypothetical protein